MSEQDLAEVLRSGAEARSLSETLGEDSGTELGDVLADATGPEPFQGAAHVMLVAEIERALTPLEANEREVLRLRFGMDNGEPRRLEEVAEHLNLPRETVRRIEKRALSKLRHPCTGSELHQLLAAG